MEKETIQIREATIRFAGDSGDGMQLIGAQFSDSCGLAGYSVNTFPDYPSEIRAPEGTLYGVSAFQVHVGSDDVYTSGDQIDVLFAMNASSLKVNLANVKSTGLIITDSNGFETKNLQLAGYTTNPLDGGIAQNYTLVVVDFVGELKRLFREHGIDQKLVRQVKNIFALGMSYWLFTLPVDQTKKWLQKKFAAREEVLLANLLVLDAGYRYASEHEALVQRCELGKVERPGGVYRSITGNEAVALGLVTAARRARLPLFLGSYPITPATEIMQYLSRWTRYGVRTLQAEDEIAGITSAIGAAYGGCLAATTTSGPGLSLKSEAIGLAIMTELPLVIIDVQRAGPSTGMPTKPEQSDLLQAFFGRHGESPVCVVAASGPTDCFEMTLEAARLAITFMTPVILLSDGYIGQSSERWRVPDINNLATIDPPFASGEEAFEPYRRNPVTLARQWAIPGMPRLEHRIGGLEKADESGTVSHDPLNHEKMVHLRKEKIARMADFIPPAVIDGPEEGDVLVITWGSSYGAAKTAVSELRREDYNVSLLNLKYLNPLPANLGRILGGFEKILVPELNTGQLKMLLQSQFGKSFTSLGKVQGRLFTSEEIRLKIIEMSGKRTITL